MRRAPLRHERSSDLLAFFLTLDDMADNATNLTWPGLEYNYLVRVKTSITLPEDLLKAIDRTDPNRSAFIERVSRAYLARLKKLKHEQRDIEIVNANARRLNAGGTRRQEEQRCHRHNQTVSHKRILTGRKRFQPMVP